MRFLFPVALLAGCLQPNITKICVENATLQNDLCDIETDAEQEEQIVENCENNAGDAVGRKCAGEAAAYSRCLNRVLKDANDCDEELFEDIDRECAYEAGLVQGCYEFGFNF